MLTLKGNLKTYKVVYKYAVLDCPGIFTIRELRQKYFKPVRQGKHCKIEYINNSVPSLNRVYAGYCGNGYKSITVLMKALKKRHNVAGGSFKISIQTL